MQAPTHILAGVLIGRLFKSRDYPVPAMIGTMIVSIICHGLLDKLGMITYHPSSIDLADPIALTYQIAMLLLSLMLIYLFWGSYRTGITCSLLPDIDGLVLQTVDACGMYMPLYQVPWLHQVLFYPFEHIIPLCYLDNLVDLRAMPWAAGIELAIAAAIWMVYVYIRDYRRNIHFR
jgi:hypothetical protein